MSDLLGDIFLKQIKVMGIAEKSKFSALNDLSVESDVRKEFSKIGRDWDKELKDVLLENSLNHGNRLDSIRKKSWQKLEELIDSFDPEIALKAINTSKALMPELNAKIDMNVSGDVKVAMTDEQLMREIVFMLSNIKNDGEDNGE